MRDQNKLKAQAFEQEAARLLQGGCNGRSSYKVEEAADFYVKAANQYKMVKMYDEAVNDLVLAADLHTQLENEYQAAKLYKDAAVLSKKSENSGSFVHFASLAVELWCTAGYFSPAMNIQKEVAEFYENAGMLDKALTAFEKAVELASAADSDVAAKTCQLKVADLNALHGKYSVAADIYLELAKTNANSALGKYRIEEYITKSCLCHLAQTDIVGAKRALQRGAEIVTLIKQTALEAVIEAAHQSDLEEFKAAVSKLWVAPDPWYNAILTKIEASIEASDDDDVL